MLEQNSSIFCSQSQADSKNNQNTQQRMSRIKRMKNIRKQKVREKRQKGIEEIEKFPKTQLTRQQKLQLQKQKNRMAAQLSRDRQKKYVQDLEQKINYLQTQIQKQICRKCRGSLFQDSSTDQEKFEDPIVNQNIEEQMGLILNSSQNRQQYFSEKDPPFLQYYRDDSSVGFNSFAKILFISMITIAVFSFSASVQNIPIIPSSGRLMQQIVPYHSNNNLECQDSNIPQLNTKLFPGSYPSQNQFFQHHAIQLKSFQDEGNIYLGADKCKADFIENYFTTHYSSYNGKQNGIQFERQKLMNCAKPQLIMKAKQDGEQGFFQGPFTLVLDDPQIFEVKPNSGGLYLQNVVPLKGLYQIEVQFMNIKKIIGQNCLN